MKALFILIIGLMTSEVFGQLSVSTGTMTPTQYVQNILVGQGVTVSNVNFVGNAMQIGSFDGSSSNIGFNSGVVLGSTDVNELVGVASTDVEGTTNVSGQPVNSVTADLLTVAQSVTSNSWASQISETYDLALLEFDFVPESDVVSFNFIFGSDEYTEYINSIFNDVFGFFVSGPGITGPFSSPAGFPNGSENLALVPGTNQPITISTIYPPGTGSGIAAGLNPQYYIDNTGGTTNALNGFTTPIPITFNVQCGETYHFKFAVSDCEDNFLGTVVFLQEGSFTSPPLSLSTSAGASGNIIEGCGQTEVYFNRSLCQSSDSLIFDLTFSGLATYGVDYLSSETGQIIIPAGEDSVVVVINTMFDGLTEGIESIMMNIDYIDNYGVPQHVESTIFINDLQPLSIDDHDTIVRCIGVPTVITAIGHGGSGVYEYDWFLSNSDSTQDVVLITQNGTYNYPVTITDECIGTYTDTVTVIMQQTLAIDTMTTQNASACVNDGIVGGVGSGITGMPHYHWEGPNTNGPNQINASVMQNLGAGWYVFTITDNVCSVTDSVLLNSNPGPVAQFTPSATSGCDPLSIDFTNTSQNATQYKWDFGNGNTANVNDLSTQNQTYSSDATIQLIAIDGPCSDTTSISITVNICGCMDPLASNFNPNAVVDNGSCIYPIPTVQAPNIFTPNDDHENDIFELNVTNATEIELIISNRWGNIMYKASGINPNPAWNGGNAPDGVYFYQYTVKGVNGQEVSGQGFVELIRGK